MKLRTLPITMALGLSVLSLAHSSPPPREADIPASLQPPKGERLVLLTHATGYQIYTCGMSSHGSPDWTLKGPEAELRDSNGKLVAHHFAGPAWKATDGSEVTGKAVAHVDSPDSRSVPWLLLSATGHSGEGLLARVTSIQRLHTKGGQPPSPGECDASRINGEVRSRYAADYYFYAPAK